MMAHKNYSISSFTPKASDIFILDTNILIKMYYPLEYNARHSLDYEELIGKIKKCKASILITSVQISEFINRCIRIQYGIYKQNNSLDNLDYKTDYRSTQDYKDNMNSILSIVRNDILPGAICINDKFDCIDPDKIYRIGFSYDFNDALLVEIANLSDAFIITNDGDFGNYTTKKPLITSNNLLLRM